MKSFKTTLAIAITVLFSSLSFGQTAPVDENGLAIGGYDVVSYFTGDAAAMGSSEFSATNDGVTYHFVSKKNKKKFMANPTKYLPQCGGYCAWGVSEKSAAFPVNPETYKIVDGKLYLFFNGDFNGTPFNTLEEWNKAEQKNLEVIDENWSKIRK